MGLQVSSQLLPQPLVSVLSSSLQFRAGDAGSEVLLSNDGRKAEIKALDKDVVTEQQIWVLNRTLKIVCSSITLLSVASFIMLLFLVVFPIENTRLQN